MKTEYKPIAMRCTQEQFDSIKDRIPLPIKNIDSFDIYNVLVNDYGDNKNVSNLSKKDLILDVEAIIDFDGELFLDCCGREKDSGITQEQKDAIIKEYLKDKVWNGSELQYRSGISNSWSKLVYVGNDEYRIKPQPNYSKEIEALENKAKENGQKVIIKIE